MSNDHYDGPERRSGEDRRAGRLKFDWTINITHVLSVALLLVGILGSWNIMDKRVLILEESKQSQRERDQAQDAASREKFQEVRDALIDLRRSVEKVSDRVGAKP